MLSCRIVEPKEATSTSDFLIDNINPGGLSFLSEKKFEERAVMKFLIKFPFSTYIEAGSVWGNVSYCLKILDKEQYVIGIAFMRKK